MENKNKRQAMGQKRTTHKKRLMKPWASVALSVTVAAALLLMGCSASKIGQPNQGNNSGVTTPSPTNNPVAPSITPEVTQAPVPTVTEIPTPTPTPEPTAWKPSADKEYRPVRALYLKPGFIQNQSKLDHYIDLANRTEINAYVIDIKNDDGIIMYNTGIEDAIAAGANLPTFDIQRVIQKLHDNDIYVIGRLVTFKDSKITKHKPELAIQSKGSIFKQGESGGRYSHWLDATNPKAWDYIAEVINEAIHFGFDEIQFDYIRFPEATLYQYDLKYEQEDKERSDYIEDFIAFIRNQIPANIVLSADIFGMPLISPKDHGKIGQRLETIGWNLDYISPMIYPSHYANNAPRGAMSNGVGQRINGVLFTHPDLDPYGVVYNTLIMGKNRIEAVEGYHVKVRPYIQGFTASYLPSGYWKTYGVEEYRAQIKAIYDAGYEEWIFWNSPNTYVEEAFLPK